MTAPVEVRDQARALREQGKSCREIGERLGIGKSTAADWAHTQQRDYARERAATAERKARKAKALAELADRPKPDETPWSFARVYAAARADGVDLLEERDAIYECPGCSRLPVEGCVCVPAREEKAA